MEVNKLIFFGFILVCATTEQTKHKEIVLSRKKRCFKQENNIIVNFSSRGITKVGMNSFCINIQVKVKDCKIDLGYAILVLHFMIDLVLQTKHLPKR